MIASDLAKMSRNEITKIDRMQSYMKGMSFFEKQNYQAALTEFEKIPGYKNTDELKEQCKANVVKQNRANRILEVSMGMVFPAMLCIVLRIAAGVSFAVLIPLFLVISAVLGFFIYRGGTPSSVIKLVSVLSIGPFLIFLIVKYGIHILFFKLCKVIFKYLIEMIKYVLVDSKK